MEAGKKCPYKFAQVHHSMEQVDNFEKLLIGSCGAKRPIF